MRAPPSKRRRRLHVRRPGALLAFLAALLLLAAAVALLLARRGAPPPQAAGSAAASPESAVPAAPACAAGPTPRLRALPEADAAPLVLGSAGGVRLTVDGGVPRRLAPGEHAVRAEHPGHRPLELRVRTDAFTPALLHADVLPGGAGLSLVHLGVTCTSCPAPIGPVSLAPAGPPGAAPALLGRAALALRDGDWPAAAEALRAVPAGAPRTSAAFLRLAARVHASALQPREARAALQRLPAGADGGVHGLLRELDQHAEAEARRRPDVATERWNRLTERYAALVARFEPQAPGAVHGASGRLEALSAAFEAAAHARDTAGMEGALAAGELALGTLVEQLRGARPRDCAFQAEVLAAARP